MYSVHCVGEWERGKEKQMPSAEQGSKVDRCCI